ncbi:MAG: hypothetical protein BWK80_12960 [Desulfobacteraceae bacterium IS3]|nr:MAG: hypothetical protein BWK80_12960 [Desulfobacteraceae bacterium IS3]
MCQIVSHFFYIAKNEFKAIIIIPYSAIKFVLVSQLLNFISVKIARYWEFIFFKKNRFIL